MCILRKVIRLMRLMNIKYISDLHLEFLLIGKIDKMIKNIYASAPILVLAGDIGNPFKHHYKYFLSHMSKKFEMTFIIAGNHEYYYNYITDVNSQCEKICNEFKNVIFLNNSTFDYKGLLFLGTTLWSRIDDHRNEINDTSCINDFSVRKYNKLHIESRDFIVETLKNTDKQVIIITHHLPSYDLINDKYKSLQHSPINQWFATDLNIYISSYKDKIKAWIYGHTHTADVTNIEGVWFYCNPVGYKGENHHVQYNKTFSC